MNKELYAKAKEAQNPKHLLIMAKQNNLFLTEDQAKELFDRLHLSDEHTDEELESVAGGCGGSKTDDDGRNRVSARQFCENSKWDPIDKEASGWTCMFPGMVGLCCSCTLYEDIDGDIGYCNA